MQSANSAETSCWRRRNMPCNIKGPTRVGSRYGEIWGDMGRYGEVAHLQHKGPHAGGLYGFKDKLECDEVGEVADDGAADCERPCALVGEPCDKGRYGEILGDLGRSRTCERPCALVEEPCEHLQYAERDAEAQTGVDEECELQFAAPAARAQAACGRERVTAEVMEGGRSAEIAPTA